MPCVSAIINWLRIHPEFVVQYTRAKDEQADALAEEMLDIADDEKEDVNRSRLRVDTRKWIASRLKPKKYGEKLELAGNKEAPLTITVTGLELGGDPPTPTT